MSEEIKEPIEKTEKKPSEKAEKPAVKPAKQALAEKPAKSVEAKKTVVEKQPAVAKPASNTATAKKQQFKITLVKSIIGSSVKQKRTIEALGLKKIRSFKVHSDCATLQGMLTVVKHLVAIEKV